MCVRAFVRLCLCACCGESQQSEWAAFEPHLRSIGKSLEAVEEEPPTVHDFSGKKMLHTHTHFYPNTPKNIPEESKGRIFIYNCIIVTQTIRQMFVNVTL